MEINKQYFCYAPQSENILLNEDHSTSIFTGSNSRIFIMCLKRKGIPYCHWFCNDPERLRDLLIMKMCRVYNRYGQVFQSSRWKKYSPTGIPNTMGKTASNYIPDCSKHYLYFPVYGCSVSLRCSIYWVFLIWLL